MPRGCETVKIYESYYASMGISNESGGGNECNTSKKCCDCNKDLEYYKDKEGKKVFRLLICSNCVSCENKKIVFRTRDANSSINIMKLTSCWIEKQERPLCFHISSFTSSITKKEEEKVRPS